ncbi:MAG: DUF4040 domain-containing protein [Cyanobacteria bacterium P01_H01_bin.58]
MAEDLYGIAIVALLPLTAGMLITQVNPYHALIIRGILGAVAALVYALFGAADVALTEALVGTMLSITLYAVAVRSSMSMRLGILEATDAIAPTEVDASSQQPALPTPLLKSLREALSPYHLRLEIRRYPNLQALQAAIKAKEIHAICVPLAASSEELASIQSVEPNSCILNIRVRRLYDLLDAKLASTSIKLNYISHLNQYSMPAATSHNQVLNSLEGQL